MRKNLPSRPHSQRFSRNFWLETCAALSLSLSLPACGGDDFDDAYIITGSGSTWVYSTRSQGLASTNYRPLLGQNIATCPPSVDAGAGCRVSTCRYNPAQIPAPVSAGAIRISGLAGEDIVLEPGEEAYQGSLYAPESRDYQLFQGGETIHFEIPGFDSVPTARKDLIAPEFITVTEPVLPEPEEDEESEDEEGGVTPLTVARAGDLAVAWELPADGAPVTVTLVVRHEEDATNVVNYSYACTVNSELGGTTLSQTYLEKFPASSDSGPATLFVGRDTGGQVLTGRWEHVVFVSSLEAIPVNLE